MAAFLSTPAVHSADLLLPLQSNSSPVFWSSGMAMASISSVLVADLISFLLHQTLAEYLLRKSLQISELWVWLENRAGFSVTPWLEARAQEAPEAVGGYLLLGFGFQSHIRLENEPVQSALEHEQKILAVTW